MLEGSYKIITSGGYYFCKSLEKKNWISSKLIWKIVKSQTGYASEEAALLDMEKYIIENEPSRYTPPYFEKTKHLLQW